MKRTLPNPLLTIAALVVMLSGSALAGPPLLCHVLNIGNAKTLPWVDLNYQKGSNGYDLKNLTSDTLAILDSHAPVLVRMETLRRAALYARQDDYAAKELLTRLHARAANSDAAGHPNADAWFDLGYLAEAYKQWWGKNEPNPANGVDGYAMVKRAISLRGHDPEMEFGAALITLSGPAAEHRDHVQKALAGAKSDRLLAQNVSPILVSKL